MWERIRNSAEAKIILAFVTLALFFQACAKEAPATAVVMPTVIVMEATIVDSGRIWLDPTIPDGYMLSVYYPTKDGGETYVNMQELRSDPESIEALSLSPEQLKRIRVDLFKVNRNQPFTYVATCTPVDGALYGSNSETTRDQQYAVPLYCVATQVDN